MEVYLELVLLLNFGVNLLLLLGTYRLSGHPPNYKRSVLSALMGGIYAGCCLLPGLYGIGKFPWRLLCLLMMAVFTFGLDAFAIRQSAIFVFLSFALNGFVVLMGNGGHLSVVLAAITLAALCMVGFGGRPPRMEYALVSISHGNKQINMTALVDTGNNLKDPVSGQRVLVVDVRVACHLLGLQEEDLRHPIETISRGKYPGLRLIPYAAVGVPSGLLLGMKVDQLRINGQRAAQIVAFAPQRIGKGSGYEALLGGIV